MSVASPAPSEQDSSLAKVQFRFCQECSNLLYPREDRALSKLLYVCKACQSVQEHEPACTYRQNLSEAAQESMGEKAYVSNDPTVGDALEDAGICTICAATIQCSICQWPEEFAVREPQDADGRLSSSSAS